MTSADELPISRLLDFDIERLYQESRGKHRASGIPIEQCLDGAAKRAGFAKDFSSLCWDYEYVLHHALSRMTLLGLYETHPVAAKWLLRQLAADLSKELIAICSEWGRYAAVYYDNALTTDEYFGAHHYGYLGQSGWHLWPTITANGHISLNNHYNDISVLVAMIGHTFYNEEAIYFDNASPLALALQQFRCDKPVMLLDMERVESAMEGTDDIEVEMPSLSYFAWEKPTPKHCYSAIEAGIKLMQLRQQVTLNDEWDSISLSWAIPPKTLSGALRKYRRAYRP